MSVIRLLRLSWVQTGHSRHVLSRVYLGARMWPVTKEHPKHARIGKKEPWKGHLLCREMTNVGSDAEDSGAKGSQSVDDSQVNLSRVSLSRDWVAFLKSGFLGSFCSSGRFFRHHRKIFPWRTLWRCLSALPLQRYIWVFLPCVPVVPLEELSVGHYSFEVVLGAIDMIYQVRHLKHVGRGRKG